MKAVLFDHAGRNRFQLCDIDEPVPESGGVLLDMRAATLNFRDHLILSQPVSPYSGDARGRIAGSDGVGVAHAISESVRGIDRGGRYMPSFFPDWLDEGPEIANLERHLGGSVPGIMAERIVSRGNSLVAVPEHLSDHEAAALPCAGVTAWAALVMYGCARANQTILVQGTGGVSILAMQIAKSIGLRIIVTSSSDTKLERAKSLGADVVINYKNSPDWAADVLDATNGRGVDHLIDVGGEATLASSLRSVAMGGHLSLVGVPGGYGGQLDGMSLRGRIIHIHTVFVESRRALQDLSAFVAEHRIRPIIDRTFPMECANAAMDTMLSGKHFGKVALSLEA